MDMSVLTRDLSRVYPASSLMLEVGTSPLATLQGLDGLVNGWMNG